MNLKFPFYSGVQASDIRTSSFCYSQFIVQPVFLLCSTSIQYCSTSIALCILNQHYVFKFRKLKIEKAINTVSQFYRNL